MSIHERFDRFAAVTDAGLADLGLDELLAELLERVREMLEVDTAAVLLLDESGSHLTATAAAGIEEEVDQGVRIPIGKGFAGRVAAEKRAVVLDEVDHTSVLNPILRHRGIRSLLGVPLVSPSGVLGVLHVGTLQPRQFTDDDVELLQLVADRMALATQANLSNAERAAARVLQRSLVPSRLPSVPRLGLAARYVPGGRGSVGGDWYDVFTLPTGLVCLAIGDVVGRGLRAAVVMGRLRSGLRAYAMETDDPAEVLTRLDRQLQHFEPGQMATLLYGVFDPSLERIHLSSAGHPPPVLAPPGEPSTALDIPPDPPLGVPPLHARRTTTVEVPAGASLCLYTDGLIERRTAPIDEGLTRLCQTVGTGDPEQECASIMAALVGRVPPSDDIALLVVKREAAANGA